MKQYTTPDQTAKLIELGFERPRYATMFWRDNKEVTEINYILGELLSFLPQFMDFDDGEYALSIEADPFKVNGTWWVFYEPSYHTESAELIDAIFAMIVKLKEKGVV
jgi:hypothetical protein